MKARSICCSAVVDADKVPKAKNMWGEFLVCNDECKKKVESASEVQMQNMIKGPSR